MKHLIGGLPLLQNIQIQIARMNPILYARVVTSVFLVRSVDVMGNNLEKKCSPCTRQSYKDIVKIDSAYPRGYYITYVCGHRSFTPNAEVRPKEEQFNLGIGDMKPIDYERLLKELDREEEFYSSEGEDINGD
jgi:hypothetical protein